MPNEPNRCNHLTLVCFLILVFIRAIAVLYYFVYLYRGDERWPTPYCVQIDVFIQEIHLNVLCQKHIS